MTGLIIKFTQDINGRERNKFYLSTYYEPSAVPGTVEVAVNRWNEVPGG